MIVTHGWPGSIIEQMKIIDPLTNPDGAWRQRSGRLPSRDPVAAGLRLLRQADGARVEPRQHRPCVGDADAAPRLHAVRGAGRRLGQRRLRGDGPAAAAGIARHSHQHGGHGSGRHLEGARVPARPPPAGLSAEEAQRVGSARSTSTRTGSATPSRCTNRPQTLYGIADSPVGLAAWMLDHDIRSYEMIARVFDGKPEGLTRDDILDNVTLYWLTNTAISSARLYWDTTHNLPPGRLLRREGRQDPGRRERLPRRDLRGARGAGRRRRIPSSSTTTSSPRAATSRPGSSRSSSPQRCARRSNRCAKPLALEQIGARALACAAVSPITFDRDWRLTRRTIMTD